MTVLRGRDKCAVICIWCAAFSKWSLQEGRKDLAIQDVEHLVTSMKLSCKMLPSWRDRNDWLDYSQELLDAVKSWELIRPSWQGHAAMHLQKFHSAADILCDKFTDRLWVARPSKVWQQYLSSCFRGLLFLAMSAVLPGVVGFDWVLQWLMLCR